MDINLPSISAELARGAIVSLMRDRLRVRELPIAGCMSGLLDRLDAVAVPLLVELLR